MATKQPSRWYPDRSVFDKYEAWDAHRKALDQIYDLQGQVRSLMQQNGSNAKETKAKKGPPVEGAGSPKETYIAGVLVKPALPKDGQRLTYKASSGQIEWA